MTIRNLFNNLSYVLLPLTQTNIMLPLFSLFLFLVVALLRHIYSHIPHLIGFRVTIYLIYLFLYFYFLFVIEVAHFEYIPPPPEPTEVSPGFFIFPDYDPIPSPPSLEAHITLLVSFIAGLVTIRIIIFNWPPY